MAVAVPDWAMRAATPQDRDAAHQAHGNGTMDITWPERTALKAWAKRRGWPAPRFQFERAFLSTMFDSDASFALALEESGVQARIPMKTCTITTGRLRELDDLYEERSPDGRPRSWGILVAALREIRRTVEAGVEVRVEESPAVLDSWQAFYTWAHGRYHLLEDGYDSWIGDDRS